MNLFHLHIPYGLIIAILCGIIFLQREVGHHTVNNDNRVTSIAYDSVQRSVQIQYIPGPVQTVQTTIPVVVDSMAIVRIFYQRNVYKQTVGDSLISAEITSVVSMNKLDSLGFKYKILRPTTITTIKDEKFKLFAGVGGGANKTSLASFGPEVAMLTSKDHLYTINYNTINKSINLSVLWKIRLKRK